MSDRFDMASRVRLEVELIELGRSLAFPVPSGGFAPGVTEAVARRAARRPWWRGESRLFGRPVRRAVLVAIALILVVAAVAGAVGLGLPGIRLILGPGPSPTPEFSPSPAASPSGPPGSGLGLGSSVPIEGVATSVSFAPLLPTAARVGRPDAAYVVSDRITFAWAPRPSMPATLAPDVGLLLTEFNGKVDPGYFGKTIDTGTVVETVSVNGRRGFWIDGVPHFFFYTDGNGVVQDESRRFVGKVLVWTSGDLTLRLETSLSRDEAIAIASSIP